MTVLYVLLGLLALIAGLLSVPVVLRVEYFDSVTVRARWLFVQFPIVPGREKKKPKKEKPKKEKPEKPEKAKKEKTGPNIFERYYEYQGIPGFVELLRRTVAALKKLRHGLWLCFCVRELKLYVRISGDDPEKLATQYGKLSAAVFPSLGWLASHLRTRKGNLRASIHPDFTGLSKKRMECTAQVSVIPSVLLCAVILLLARLGLRVVLRFIRGARAPRSTQSVGAACQPTAA